MDKNMNIHYPGHSSVKRRGGQMQSRADCSGTLRQSMPASQLKDDYNPSALFTIKMHVWHSSVFSSVFALGW